MKKKLLWILTLAALLAGQQAFATIQNNILLQGKTQNNSHIYVIQSFEQTEQFPNGQGSSHTFNNAHVIQGTQGTPDVTLNGTLNFQEGTALADVITSGTFTVTIESSSLWFYGAKVQTKSGSNVSGCSATASSDRQTITVTIPSGKTFGAIIVDYVSNAPMTDQNTTVTVPAGDYWVSDSNHQPKPEPTVVYGQTTLVKDTDYTLSWSNNGSAGTAGTVTVNGKGNYAGSVSANFNIRWATYTVRFDKNHDDATGTMSDQQFTYNTAQNLTDNTFSLGSYPFAGWSTTPDGAVTYTDGQSVSNLTAVDGETVTLYAQWTPPYTFDSSTGALTLNWGEFNKDNKWGDDVNRLAVTSVTATNEVSFTGDCYNLFYYFTNCTSMDLSDVNTDGLTNIRCMFWGCSSLTTLDLSSWNTAAVTAMTSAFRGCEGLTSLNLTGWNTGSVTTMENMFYECHNLATIEGISEWVTESVTNMKEMFYQCSRLTSLDLSGWNTANVIDMEHMFSGCSSFQTLDLSSWNTANVTKMDGMFRDCSSLTTLNLSGWNTANVTKMGSMFNGCSNLQSLDISGWDTAKVTEMGGMFRECSSLTTLNLSGWNTAKVTGMVGMFYGCSNLTAIFVGKDWNTASVTISDDMFSGCTSLVGGNGTTYNSSHTDKEYARIDKGTIEPGYLTGVFALTLGEGITATPAATLTHGNVNLYAYGTQITLAYGGSVPAGDVVVYLVNGIGIEGNRFEMPAEDVTVTVRSVGPSKSFSVEQATIFSEGKYITSFYDIVPYQLPAGALAYTASLDGDNVVFHRIGEDSDIIPANTAVIIVADASAVTAEMITLTKLDSASGITARTGNILQGSDEPVEVTDGQIGGKTVYVLGKDENGTLGFYRLAGNTIPAGKAYYVK